MATSNERLKWVNVKREKETAYGRFGEPQPIRRQHGNGRQLQTERPANWARGRKVKPDQDPTHRSTGHPYVSVP